jgi:hypothetical protein
MIKRNELRIGNYVMDNVSGEWMIVDEIGENVGAIVINRDKYPLPEGWNMGYIPLTPEILERCGFEQNSPVYGDYYNNGDIFIFKEKDGFMLFDEGSIGNPFNYLHQLQNLFFALTGEELEINLNSPATIHNQN